MWTCERQRAQLVLPLWHQSQAAAQAWKTDSGSLSAGSPGNKLTRVDCGAWQLDTVHDGHAATGLEAASAPACSGSCQLPNRRLQRALRRRGGACCSAHKNGAPPRCSPSLLSNLIDLWEAAASPARAPRLFSCKRGSLLHPVTTRATAAMGFSMRCTTLAATLVVLAAAAHAGEPAGVLAWHPGPPVAPLLPRCNCCSGCCRSGAGSLPAAATSG